MDAIWVVVANQAGASIYQASQRGEVLSLIDEFEHDAGKAHFQELVSDGPGRVQDRTGVAPHSPARWLPLYLESAAERGAFRRLIIVSAPEFLGIVRKHVAPHLTERIVLEIPKDIVEPTTDRVQALLNREL